VASTPSDFCGDTIGARRRAHILFDRGNFKPTSFDTMALYPEIHFVIGATILPIKQILSGT
jgi:hypothetical protein